MTGVAKNLIVGAAITVELLQPGVPEALMSRTDLDPETQEATSSLVAHTREAVEEGAAGARRGEDDARAERLPEPESFEWRPPEPGSTWEAGAVEPHWVPEPLTDEPLGTADMSEAAPSSGASPAPEPATHPVPEPEPEPEPR